MRSIPSFIAPMNISKATRQCSAVQCSKLRPASAILWSRETSLFSKRGRVKAKGWWGPLVDIFINNSMHYSLHNVHKIK